MTNGGHKCEQITLVDLLGEICTRSLFMAKLAKITLSTLLEFMDKANNFVNRENTLQALTNPQRMDGREVKKNTCKDGRERSRQEQTN